MSRSTTWTPSNRPPQIWCDRPQGRTGTEKYVSPKTHCVVDGNRFLANAKDETAGTLDGYGWVTRSSYRVMDLDPDAGALSLEQLCRSAVRAFAIELNGDSGSFAPAGLRSTGFAVAELARADTSAGSGRRTARRCSRSVEQPGTPQPREKFHFEESAARHPVGGVGRRHQEMAQPARASGDGVVHRYADPHTRSKTQGMLQNPPLSRAPGDPNNPYYVHEVLAGWDGWSLSAPDRVSRSSTTTLRIPNPGRERIDDTPESTTAPGLWVRSTVKDEVAARAALWPQVLLPHRRCRSRRQQRADGSDTLRQPSPKPLIDAAAAHLDELRAEARPANRPVSSHSLRGSLKPSVPGSTGTREAIERATASVIEHASSLRRYPQWEDVDLEQLAALFADAEDRQRCHRAPPVPAVGSDNRTHPGSPRGVHHR